MISKRSFYPLYYLAAHYPLRAAVVTGALLVSSISEGLGILALLPLLQFVISGSVSGNSTINDFFRDLFNTVGVEVTLPNTLLFIVALITLKAAAKLLASYVVSASAAKITADFRSRLIDALMRANWLYFTSKPAGHISTAINNEPQLAAHCIIRECGFVAEIFQITAYIVIALFISWQITLASILVGGAGTLLLRSAFKLTVNAGEDQTNSQKFLAANVLDSLRIMKPVRAMAREKHLQPFIRENIQKLETANRWILFSPDVIEQGNEVIKVFALALGLYILIDIWPGSIESLFLLAILFVRIFQRLNMLQKNYIMILSYIPSFLYTLQTITEAEKEKELWSGKKEPAFAQKIEFRNVSYDHKDKEVLKNISFALEKNTFILIAGPSGAGKSTLIDLMCGLYTAQKGQVTVDGINLMDLDIAHWRTKIGYIPQDPVLLNDTVRNNITLYDAQIGDEQVWRALRRAGAEAFVVKNPQGLSAMVGESGSQLSGGQRQRIMIARALVKNPEILVLDEATSGLEAETENAIFSELRSLGDGLTIIAITHNPRLKQYADTVYTLENHDIKRAA